MDKIRMTYREGAERLAEAVDIAVKIVTESAQFGDDFKTPMINFCNQVKQKALNPEPQFKKLQA